MRKIDTIIVHCTATRAEWWESRSAEDKMAECKSWHLDRGWSDIGYHYLRLCLGAIAVRLRPVCAELKILEPTVDKAEPNEYPHHHLPMYEPR